MEEKKIVSKPKLNEKVEVEVEVEKTDRRGFLKKAGVATAGAIAGTTAFSVPTIYSKTRPIRWRLQTYSGAPLGAHVIKPQIEAFNRAAHGQMEIQLYYADQLVPTSELFRSLQNGTIDAVQSDDATMASPVSLSRIFPLIMIFFLLRLYASLSKSIFNISSGFSRKVASISFSKIV